MTGDEHHVRFGTIDAAAEEERSARGQQHRKDLVLGFRLQKENEKIFRDVQMKTGYDWLRGFKDPSELSALSLGIRLTVHGFLAFFYLATSEEKTCPEEIDVLFKHFQASSTTTEEFDLKLQEHLILIAIIAQKDFGLGILTDDEISSLHGSDKFLRMDTP